MISYIICTYYENVPFYIDRQGTVKDKPVMIRDYNPYIDKLNQMMSYYSLLQR